MLRERCMKQLHLMLQDTPCLQRSSLEEKSYHQPRMHLNIIYPVLFFNFQFGALHVILESNNYRRGVIRFAVVRIPNLDRQRTECARTMRTDSAQMAHGHWGPCAVRAHPCAVRAHLCAVRPHLCAVHAQINRLT